MSSNELKAKIEDAVRAHGRAAVLRALVCEGVGLHTADKLAGARYPSDVGALMSAAISRALAKLSRVAS